MQPIHDTRLQNQLIPPRPMTSGQNGAVRPEAREPRGGAGHLPEDVVDLSKDRAVLLDQAEKKEPSRPVTTIERRALQAGFSVYA